ncbi:hypothetical protein BU15DRAFT_73043 [Melanogaster broomeanus]|nr:hypothetical protein BU15DRAFT_73043 [Melanogaster broomeanus]
MVSKLLLTTAATALLAGSVKAICPGYNYGIAMAGNDPSQMQISVFDGSCNVLNSVTSNTLAPTVPLNAVLLRPHSPD